MKVAIIEDEALAADRLEEMILEVAPEIEILAKLKSVKDSVAWLSCHTADLLFIDIQLSDGLSFSIFDTITTNIPVVFTTAYNQYAIQAFKLNSISYLLKPIRKSELAESLQKYKSLKTTFTIDVEELLNALKCQTPEFKKRFLIQLGEKIKKVEVSDIAYFYSLGKNVLLKTNLNQSYPIEFSLDRLQRIIDPAIFFRINRKFFINIDSITNMTSYSRGRLNLSLKPVPGNIGDSIVSVERSSDFRKWLNS